MKNSIQKCTELGMTLVTGRGKEDGKVSIEHYRKAEGKLGRGKSIIQTESSLTSQKFFIVCACSPNPRFWFLGGSNGVRVILEHGKVLR